MRRTRVFALIALGLVPLAAACNGGGGPAAPASASASAPAGATATPSEDELWEGVTVTEPSGPFAGSVYVPDLAADTAAGCDGFRAVLGAHGVLDCAVAEGPGGIFATVHQVAEGGKSQVVDYLAVDAGTWSSSWASEPVTVGTPSAEAVPEFSGVVIGSFDLDGFPVIATAFEQAVAGGTVREFAVRGWFEGEPVPESRQYDPERDAVLWADGDAVVVTYPLLDSGPSAGAPTRAAVRHDRWLGPFEFDNSVENLDLDDLPEPPDDAIGAA